MITPVPKRPNGTGSVYLRGKIWWIKYYQNGRYFCESSRSKERDVANKALQRRLGEVASGTFVEPSVERTTILELVDLVVEDYKFRQLSSLPTVVWQRGVIEGTIGKLPAARVCPMTIKRYVIQRRQQKASDATINRELALVRRGFNLAMQLDPPIVARVPKITLLREDNARQGFLEPEEYERLLTELPDRLKALFVVAYHAGARKGELRKIRREQVDFDAMVIRLAASQTKSKKARVLPIYGDMERWLRQQIENMPANGKWVFNWGTKQLGNHLDGWAEACERAELPDLLFHDLRRSAVRNMKRAGVQDKVAMEISGHKTRSVFDRYNIVDESDLSEAASKVNAYFAARKQQRAAKLRRVK